MRNQIIANVEFIALTMNFESDEVLAGYVYADNFFIVEQKDGTYCALQNK